MKKSNKNSPPNPVAYLLLFIGVLLVKFSLLIWLGLVGYILLAFGVILLLQWIK